MTTFHSLEGIEGYRWGLFFRRDGEVLHSADAPVNQANFWARIRQMLDMLPDGMKTAELIFDLGRILIRSGQEGRILLFCDRLIKLTAINLVVAELLDKPRGESSLGGEVTDSNFSLIRTLSLEDKEIPSGVIDALLQLFTEILGPLAPKLAKGTARKNQLDLSHLQEKDWSKLLNLLAGQITDEQKRDRFLDHAVTLKNKF